MGDVAEYFNAEAGRIMQVVSWTGEEVEYYNGVKIKHGMVLSGMSPDGRLVEMIELPQHPYFVGCQFHPEFKSRPRLPHPLFARFIRAAVERQMSVAKLHAV